MPDFYDMHVALCREKRTPKRTPLCDAASPTATLLLLTLALPLTPPGAPGERANVAPDDGILSVKPQKMCEFPHNVFFAVVVEVAF